LTNKKLGAALAHQLFYWIKIIKYGAHVIIQIRYGFPAIIHWIKIIKYGVPVIIPVLPFVFAVLLVLLRNPWAGYNK
jgi:hypothetical protein